MQDLDNFPLRPIASLVVGIFRALVWLWSEFLFDTLGWKIGWCVSRVLTFGKLPEAGFTNEHEATTLTRISVELIGIGTLCFTAWRLSIAFSL